MALKPITVNTPAAEPAHILAEDDAAIYAALIGDDRVLDIGGKLAATVISNNKVRITDGVVVVGGHAAIIYKGDYEDMTIENGVSGKKRNDLIVARFIAGDDGGADSYQLVVVKGTAGTSATDPAIVQGNLYNGDKQRDYPLWRVKIEGLSITAVEQLYTVNTTNTDLSDSLSQLNENLEIELIEPALNTTDFTANTTWAHKQGKQVIVYPYVTGVPVKNKTIATGLPAPKQQVNVRDTGFGIVTLNTAGKLYISSQGVTTSSYFAMPFSYFTE